MSPGLLFKRYPAPLLGIDISSSSVKLVELGRRREGDWVLERCAIEPLESGCVTDGSIENFDAVAEAVRRVVRRSGSRTRQVALALPSSAVITKKITLPDGLTERELEERVEIEAHQYIPFSLAEVSLDFCVIGPGGPAATDVEVLIAASPKEKVQDRQGLAEAAGLKAVILALEQQARDAGVHHAQDDHRPGGPALRRRYHRFSAAVCGAQPEVGRFLFDLHRISRPSWCRQDHRR